MQLVQRFLASYGITFPLRPQTPQALGRILPYALHHDHKVTPFHVERLRLGIIVRKPEPPALKTLNVHGHAAVLRMDELHQPTAAAYEDEDIAVHDLAAHPFLHHADEGVYALAHVYAVCAQIVAHRVI